MTILSNNMTGSVFHGGDGTTMHAQRQAISHDQRIDRSAATHTLTLAIDGCLIRIKPAGNAARVAPFSCIPSVCAGVP